MQTISKEQIKQWMDNKEDMLLIDVLSKESFGKQHIPNAINIPVKENPNFVKDVEARAGSKDKRIVVYCANLQCDASHKAAQQLEEAGFTNVHRFEEGLEGWFRAKAAA